jgi:formate dehydrogenase major subunit
MVLTTGRMLEHWHTGAMTRRASVLDALEPEAVVSVSPKDMQKMGLNAGDWVRVGTRRAAISLRVRRDRNVPEGALFIPFCFSEAPANFLTNPQLDPYGKIPEFKFCAARIEPIAEPVAPE